jgi:2'-5' RNA ligase
MSDIVSIELTFDAATEAAVRTEWEALAAAGLSSMAAHTAESNRPHLTLLARTSSVPHTFAAGRMLPMPVTLGAPILFGQGERRVLARSVIVSAELLAFHASVHTQAGPGDDAPHTEPGRWTPHVTLARRLRVETLAAALELLGADVVGDAVALRRWDSTTRTVTLLA